MWGWVADHNIDTGDLITVKNPKGFSAEGTTQALTMYSVAFEHSSEYQFKLNNVRNVRFAVTQTESPYWQSPPTAAGMSISNSQDVIGFGNGYYNWFMGTQSDIFPITNSTDIHLFVPNVNVPQVDKKDLGVKRVISGDHPVSAGDPYDESGFCAHFAVGLNF